MADGSGSTGWSFDVMGRILTEQRTIAGNTKTLSYAYNLDGSLASITYPSGSTVTYSTGNAQRPLSATDSGHSINYASSASYAPTGGLGSVVFGLVSGTFGGITEQRAYNNRLELTSIQASSSNGTAMNLAYCFTTFSFSAGCSSASTNNNGRITGITNGVFTNESQILAHDLLNRISSAATKGTSGTDCWGQSFGPDAVANLASIGVTQCSAGSLSVTTDGNNHLSATGFGYDSAGNMTNDASYAYFFDAENRITQVNGTAGNCSTATACYTFDAKGMRVEKSTGTLYWRSPGGKVLAESSLSGSITNEYVFFAGRRIARRDSSGNVYYFFADHLHTTHTVTNATGQPCYDASFTPYGQEVLNPNVTSTCPPNYKFTGYELDSETGNFYAFARHYSPRLARFLSADPLVGSVANPQSMNRYAYVLNMPVMAADPSGGCTQVAANSTDDGEHKGLDSFVRYFASDAEPQFPTAGNTCPASRGGSGAADDGGYGGSGIYLNGEWMPSAGIVGGSDASVACPNNSCVGTVTDQNGQTTRVQFSCGMTACGYQSFEQMATQTYECGNSFCSQLGYVQWAIQLAPKAAQSQLDALNARLGLNLTLDDAAYLNGGNLNFTVPVGFIVPSNCSGSGDGRCTGDLDGIHFVDGYQYVHLDTANPWTSPGGFFAHTGVDVLLGNVGYLIIPRGCVTASNQPC